MSKRFSGRAQAGRTLVIAMALCAGAGVGASAAPAQGNGPLLQCTFGNEAAMAGWTGTGAATLSDVSRRPGERSLLIKQWQDDEAGSAWMSPPVASPGGPVKISFWAADNYLSCTDFSYAACLNAVDFAKDGHETGKSDYLFSMAWDDSRKEDMWGKLLPEGLVWRYYEALYTPIGDTFRLKFHWPKAIVRGDCYLTQLMVTRGDTTPGTNSGPQDGAAAGSATGPAVTGAMAAVKEAAGAKLALELSTPVNGNLFELGDPLQFAALLYTRDGTPLAPPADATLNYQITDYQRFAIAHGTVAFAGAGKMRDADFIKSPVGTTRRENLVKSFVVDDAAAKTCGQEYFLQVSLSSQGKILAADTVTYGVVDPTPGLAASDASHFSMGNFDARYFPGWGVNRHESVAEKMGATMTQVYDYYWVKVQPHYPGPMNFGPALPAFPRITFCPNIEQERTSTQWIHDEVPPEAIIPDPLHPGRITFEIDPYVQYIVAYIRHNRAAIARVVPSGLERPIDARTIELHRKVYAAIKKEFPDLPVGFMIYGLSMNPSDDVDIFLREKLYECCDFIDTHVYASSVDWTEWERLQAAYTKLGLKPVPLVSTEFSRVGGTDQVQRSRAMFMAHLDAFAHGMNSLYYFNQINTSGNLPQPFLREPTNLGGDQTSGFMYMQKVDRPVMVTGIVMEPRLSDYRWLPDFGGGSLMPLLQTMTYYNLVQNFEGASYRETLHPDADSLAYVFDRGDTTTMALWQTRPVGARSVMISAAVPFTVCDLFGRRHKINPVAGSALITIDENPLTLIFDSHFDKPVISPIAGGLKVDPVARGGAGTAHISIPSAWGYAGKLKVVCTVDGTWPKTTVQTVKVKQGRDATLQVPFTIDMARAVDSYPLSARLYDGDKLVGMLRADLQVRDLLAVAIDGEPLTKTATPAVRVTLRSLKDTQTRGTVTFDDRYFTDEMRPQLQSRPYTIGPHATAEVSFPVSPRHINLSTSYSIPVTVTDNDGSTIRATEEVGFRACERATRPIAIDGDLGDWNLEAATAIPFSREFTVWGKADKPLCTGELYTRWDDNNLYFAVTVKKHDAFTHRANDIGIWTDDNIMFGLYPWRWKRGETVNSGFYREHLGLCADGVARIFRVGNVAGGATTAEGAQIAVKQTVDGYVYEWRYARQSLYPLELKAGAGFRLSMFALDSDPALGLRGIQIGGFNENVDARPERWREFVLAN